MSKSSTGARVGRLLGAAVLLGALSTGLIASSAEAANSLRPASVTVVDKASAHLANSLVINTANSLANSI